MKISKHDRHVVTVSIVPELCITHEIVWMHMEKVGYTKKLIVCMPRGLPRKILMNRMAAETQKNRPILEVDGVELNEKRIAYNDVK